MKVYLFNKKEKIEVKHKSKQFKITIHKMNKYKIIQKENINLIFNNNMPMYLIQINNYKISIINYNSGRGLRQREVHHIRIIL